MSESALLPCMIYVIFSMRNWRQSDRHQGFHLPYNRHHWRKRTVLICGSICFCDDTFPVIVNKGGTDGWSFETTHEVRKRVQLVKILDETSQASNHAIISTVKPSLGKIIDQPNERECKPTGTTQMNEGIMRG